MFQALERIFQGLKRTFQSLKHTFQSLKYKKIGGLGVFVGSDGEDITLVEVIFCVEGHIIIFKEEIGEVVVDAATSELDNRFFLCPETDEWNLGVGRGLDKSEFLRGEDVTSEGFAVTANCLNINAYGLMGKDTSDRGFAMGNIKV